MSEKKNVKNQEPVNETAKPVDKYQQKLEYKKKQEEKAKKSRNTLVLIAVIVIAAIAAVLIYRVYDKHQKVTATQFTIGDYEITKPELDYYTYTSYNNFMNTYGEYASYFGLDTSKSLDSQYYTDDLTWLDYFQQDAVYSMQQIYGINDAADEAGFEYDASEEVDELMEGIQEAAASYGYSETNYIKALYGSYATKDLLKQWAAFNFRADAYYNQYAGEIVITDDEVASYYEQNPDSYDIVDYLLCEIDAEVAEEETETEAETEAETEELTEEEQAAIEAEEAEKLAAAMAEAKAKAEEMLEKADSEGNFVKYFKQYNSDNSDTASAIHNDEKKSDISQSAVAEYLFDEARAAGDTTIIEDTDNSAYYVVYFVSRELDQTNSVDFRHILITEDSLPETETAETEAETDDESETSDADETDAVLEMAESVYAEWQNGEATEDSFAALAGEYTQDSGSSDNGGLYEKVIRGQMETSINDWIFDEARSEGDTDIVESSYGYHIMYFAGENDPEYVVSIRSTIQSSKLSDFLSEQAEKETVNDPNGNLHYLVVEKAQETAAETATETESASE
ncbi:MAG: peptidyl-prolyl cis-trans isomerase [Lachnospiraceae bacterium]|nr:peptidyl-prolyl cis-trans isomerase [Lachnospiraceae bacterium]